VKVPMDKLVQQYVGQAHPSAEELIAAHGLTFSLANGGIL
jgi:hypothetical protein